MEIDDAYAELGLTPQASEAEVKAAWRRLAARWHPDRNDSPGAVLRMQHINRALEEIRRSRLAAEAGAPEEASDPGDADTSPGDDRHAGASQAAGPDRILHLAVRLTLEEAALGCVTELRGEVVDDCPDCAATGVLEIAGGCGDCGGTGRVRRHAWFGWLSEEFECAACQGSGTARLPCAGCGGTGRLPPRGYRHRVRIPAGVRDGDRLEVPARPSPDGGPAGDALELSVELLPHPFFVLDEDGTVRCELPVDGFAWMANRWINVPTPGGLQQMKLDRGHLVYRLRGQGYPVERGGARGDCLVRIEPLFPPGLGDEQEALLDRLVATNSGDPASAAGARCSAWRQALQDWQERLPPRPRQDDEKR